MKALFLSALRRGLLGAAAAALAAALPSTASAAYIATLSEVSPSQTNFTFGIDFQPMLLSGTGAVTAPLQGIALTVPPTPSPSSSSGCLASDFAGPSVAGKIALLQRGGCSFQLKVDNALAAGAAAVLIFNEGQPGRTDLGNFTLDDPAPIPVFFLTYSAGQYLSEPGKTVSLSVSEVADVPAPAALTLLALAGSAALLRRRRRQ